MPEPLVAGLPVAHAGHWIVWVLYAVPLVAVLVALWISSRRARGERDAENGGGERGP